MKIGNYEFPMGGMEGYPVLPLKSELTPLQQLERMALLAASSYATDQHHQAVYPVISGLRGYRALVVEVLRVLPPSEVADRLREGAQQIERAERL